MKADPDLRAITILLMTFGILPLTGLSIALYRCVEGQDVFTVIFAVTWVAGFFTACLGTAVWFMTGFACAWWRCALCWPVLLFMMFRMGLTGEEPGEWLFDFLRGRQ